MDDILKRLEALQSEAESDLKKISDQSRLEQFGLKYLSRKGAIPQILDQLKTLTPELRKEVGKRANLLKNFLEQTYAEIGQRISAQTGPVRGEDFFDYTLPGRQFPVAGLHPLTQVTNEIVEIFYRLGFELATGPEIETDYYNFEALNFAPWHPARDMQDTFYLDNNYLLRTHTSPVQIRTFENQKPPLKIIAPGRVYRHEE